VGEQAHTVLALFEKESRMSTSPKWRALFQLSAMMLGVLAVTGGAAWAAPPTDGASHAHPSQAAAAQAAVPAGTVFLAANLRGKNEIPTPGGPAVGDPDGRARAVVRIRGTEVCFTTTWSGIAPPTAAHIHVGAAGVNGGIVVGLFGFPPPGGTLPASVRTVSGCQTGTAEQVDAIKANPAGFYANIHTADFPDGAVRGQLHASGPVDLLGFARGPLVALADGGQEEPDLGDADGRATAFVRARTNGTVTYAVTWQGIGQPRLGHIHTGAIGVAGPVAVDLFIGEQPLPAGLTAAAGEVAGIDRALIRQINRRPANYYVNLHNAEFPGGAVRGQLFRAGSDTGENATFTAAVVRGVQIYACTAQPDGTFKFTQHNVRATLQGNIRHSFVNNTTGPPQWISRDGSAVTGRVISRSPNGAGNIDELELQATQSGDADGQMSRIVEILRLNTVGGVAPAGPCDPNRQPFAEVPYKADYVFIAA
jgi:CHRD domain/Protein of unknown function (DUF3455)